jgi:hypothetical protein
MDCSECGNEMMAIWYASKNGFVVPIFECVHCDQDVAVPMNSCEQMMAWVQAIVLGEGGREDG